MWTAGIHKGYGRFKMPPEIIAHRVSYILHVGPIPDGMVVRHRCDNAACVNPRHLDVGTQADNIEDKVSKDRQAKGETDGNARLLECQVRAILALVAAGHSPADLATQYGVHVTTIHRICAGIAWAHVTGGVRTTIAAEPRKRRGDTHHNAKLTEDSVRDMRVRWASGATDVDVARVYGVAPPTVRRIRIGKSWAHVR